MVASLADQQPGELSALYEELLQKLFKGDLNANEIDPATTLENAQKFMQGVYEGYGADLSSVGWDTPDYDKLSHLERNVYQFSAAKNWQQLRDLTDALKDGDKVRSFSEFKKAAMPILNEYQGSWLQTEYNAAIAGSQMASKWVDFEKAASLSTSGEGRGEVLLEYRTMEDMRVRPEHAELNLITRPVGDAFWNRYYPPNGWNCRCTVIRLNEGKATPDKKMAYPDIAKAFDTNLAKNGMVLPMDMIKIGTPPRIFDQADRLLFKQQQQFAIDKLVGKVEVKRPELSSPIIFSKAGIKEAFNQPMAPKLFEAKNSALRNVDDILKTASYKGFNTHKANDEIVGSHIFEINIGDKKLYPIVRQHSDGTNRFYSISDSKKVLKGTKRKSG